MTPAGAGNGEKMSKADTGVVFRVWECSGCKMGCTLIALNLMRPSYCPGDNDRPQWHPCEVDKRKPFTVTERVPQ